MKSKHIGRSILAIAAGLVWAAAAQAAAPQTTKSHESAKPQTPDKTQAKAAPIGQVWDWSKIDTNKDNLIEPAEMEAWLKANPGTKSGG